MTDFTGETAIRGFSEVKDFRIATLGNVDSGKSTLTGVLTRGILDDGKGKARSFVLRHSHEQKKGQSSTVSVQLIGYRDGEQVLPSTASIDGVAGRVSRAQNKDFFEVATKSTHRISVIDLCGHQKYLKSSIYGLTAMSPDCALVVLGAERGVQRMTREHLGLACALKIPFFVVVTKIDVAPPDVRKDAQQKLKRLLKRAGRKALFVRSPADADTALKCITQSMRPAGNSVGSNSNNSSESKDDGNGTGSANTNASFAPVFEVSCVTAENLDLLKDFVKRMALAKTELCQTVANSTATDSLSEAKTGDASTSGVAGTPGTQVGATDERAGAGEAEQQLKNPKDLQQASALRPVISEVVEGSGATAMDKQSGAHSQHCTVRLDDTYSPPGVGIVVGGTVRSGEVHVGQKLFVGPT